jgi:hypothetical protein
MSQHNPNPIIFLVKYTYRMSCEELQRLKEMLNQLILEGGGGSDINMCPIQKS